MAMVSFITIWLAQLAFCLFFALRPWAAEQSLQTDGPDRTAGLPLTVLCGMILTACTAGCLGHLRAGIFLILALALAALLWTGAHLYQGGLVRAKEKLRACVTPAWVIALGGSLVLALFLAWQNPLPTQWDEFSFWATAAKVVKENDALYTLVAQTNLEARSYPAALPVLSYLFQWAAPTFRPWLLYTAYGTVYFGVFGAMAGLLGRGRWRWAAFAAVVCGLAPFVVESWYPQQMLVAYATAYSDLMLGLLTAGGCVVWLLAVRDQREGPLCGWRYATALLQTALVIAVLGLTKDVGLPLGLVVMLVCVMEHFACDFLRHPKDARAWLRLIGVLLVLTLAAGLAFYGWAVHLSASQDIDRGEVGGSAQIGPAEMVIRGVKELLGVGRTEKFAAVLSAMIAAFFGRRVSVFGSGLYTVLVIGGIFLLAFWLEPKQKRRPVMWGLASGAGFVGYYFFQLICYVYVFSDGDGRALASYERYMSSYYLFWLLAALAVLFCAVRAGRRWSGMSLAAVSLVVVLFCGRAIDPKDTFLGRNAASWYTESLIQSRADQAAAVAQPEDTVLLVSQWDDSARWYRYAYALDPVPLFHAKGDNTIVLPETAEDQPLVLDKDTIGDFLQKEQCTLLLLDVVDYDFWQEFESLFTDHMERFLQSGQSVYRVEYQGDNVQFVPAGEKEAAL